jgi:iron(III)-enterobactin esterase
MSFVFIRVHLWLIYPEPFMRHALLALLLPLSLAACATSPTPSLLPADRLGEGKFIIGPDYADAPEIHFKNDVPKGAVKDFTMKSQDSLIYKGIARNKPGITPYTRRCSLYIPAGYTPGTPLPFIVVQDGMGYKGPMVPALDNLIHEKRIPPIAAIFLDSGGGDAQGSERGLEYDTVSGTYSDFVETEVLPRLTKDYNVTFTTNPDGRATMGGSSGAACALTMAWFHPERYHRVLSYSGTFVNQQSPENPASLHGAWEYHEHFIMAEAAKPIRIWMHVSENDLRVHDPESTFHNWIMANDRMAACFQAQGYHYQYVFAKNAGHVDGKVVHQTLPAALEWLWKGYPVE